MSTDEASLVDRDYLRANLLPFTRKAFRMLPELDGPNIIDVGCGTGVVTLELARLSNGRVVGVDIDQTALDRLKSSVEQVDFGYRVSVVKCSMCDMKFAANSFDIIWSEGSIFVIGFEQGLARWRNFIRADGFLVVHARMIDIEERVRMIPKYGYCLLKNFFVPKDAWWNGYYGPLERHLDGLLHGCKKDTDVLPLLKKIQKEIDEFKTNPEYQGSVFYLCQKTGE
ncbi:MAG: class I SAM-dependent methyltransferase [candidate division WOR-3 bacterium]|nr:class I SAM-dependent methyltransferase [candidate division WOR-3 bacterium]